MKLELNLAREQFLLGESIDVGMRLRNTGAQAVQAPKLRSPQNTQPVYRIEGPSFPGGQTFSLRDLELASEPGALRSADQPETVPLGAGASLETGFKLDQLQAIGQPGDYSLAAGIQWAGWSAMAAPVAFKVAAARYLEASLCLDTAAPSSRQLRVVWLAQTKTGRVLGETFMYEHRPDLGEFKTTGSRIVTVVGPAATAAFCPWTNFDRNDAANAWHGWREGRQLLAIAMGERHPLSFELDAEQALVVRPALLQRRGDMDVLVLDAARKRLQAIRFFAPAEKQPPKSPASLWHLDLPQAVQAARVAIGPLAEGGSRLALLVSQQGSKLVLRLLRMSDQSAVLDTSVTLDDAFVLPGSEPGLMVQPDGSARAALVFARDPTLRSLAAADVAFSKAGEIGLSLAELGRMPSAPAIAAANFRVTADGAEGRSWFVGFADGAVLGGSRSTTSISNDARLHATDFLRMSGASYVLMLDPDRGPILQAAGF